MIAPFVIGAAAAEKLAEVHAAAFDRPWSAGDFAEIAASAGVLTLADDGLAGFVMVRVIADEAEILTLAVKPAAQRRGLGLALVEGAVAAAAVLGARSLWLEVAVDNTAALALYERAGFGETGRRPGYYRRGNGGTADAVVMRRTLNTAAC